MNEFLFCPRCGMFSKADTPCEYCGMVGMQSTGRSIPSLLEIQSREYESWRVEFTENVINKNPLYDPAIHRNVINKIIGDGMKKSSNIPHCPNCGYDRFQIVQRKWSLLGGFLTNKVDRICERCKTRF